VAFDDDAQSRDIAVSDAGSDLAHDRAAVRVHRRALVRRVDFAGEPGDCETLEGRVSYEAGDALVTGEKGECWPVRRALFQQSYQAEPPTVAGEDGFYRRVEKTLLAKRLDHPVSIELAPGRGRLSGKVGDWLVQQEDGNQGIVAAALFAGMYDELS
jgi:hypothetical protein